MHNSTVLISIKGFFTSLTIVLIIYFLISYSYEFSGTDDLLPQAKYISCMVIYAFGYIYSTIKVFLLKQRKG